MGATDLFEVAYGYGPGKQEMIRAYDDLVAEAVHDYGYDYYNGTISTTNGARIYGTPTDEPINVGDLSNNIELRDKIFHETRKGEEAVAFYIYEDTKSTTILHGQTPTVRVRVEHEGFNIRDIMRPVTDEHFEVSEKVHQSINKKITAMVKSGEIALPEDVYPKKFINTYMSVLDLKIVRGKHKTETITTEGKRDTRYFIVNDQRHTMPRWEDGYASQAEARKNLPDDIRSGVTCEIISMTRRASGEGLVQHVSAGYTTKTIDVEFTGQINVNYDSGREPRTGWAFLGKASI